MCLLRTGLAFTYLWEGEFFLKVHESLLARARGVASNDQLRSLFDGGVVLANFEPPSVPATEKSAWPAISQLLARGYEARKRILDSIETSDERPQGTNLLAVLDNWIASLSPAQLEPFRAPLQPKRDTANNQKEFVRYLIQPRSSDDDAVDQADFYYLARTNSRHVWFHPGPEWLVVVTSLLCLRPGGYCTLGQLLEDLGWLGVKVERSVLIGLLEEAGLSTDSPDADNALVIRSGF
jgi:hypothetical protein